MKKLLFITLVLSQSLLFAQHDYLPLSNEFEQKYNYLLYQKDADFHSSIKPFRSKEVNKLANIDSLNQTVFYKSKFAKTWFGGALFNNHFLEVRTDEFDLSIDPSINWTIGKEREGSSDYTYVNSRGLYIQGRIGSQVTFMSSFSENQARFADYVNQQIETKKVVPGQGLARDFNETAYDFSNAYGVVSFTPSKFFNFSLGQGKNFFGEGYRTTFLGDAAFNYPFFRIETTVWKIKYVNLWTQQRDIRNEVEVNDQYRKKWTSMHYLSYNVNSRLNISLFEAVIYKSDTMNRGLEASYFNPIILYRPIEFANNSDAGNVMIGIGLSYKLFNDFQLYGQFTLDEFVKAEIITEPGSWRNKYSLQLGGKYFNAFGVPRLNFLAEFNAIRPYMYSHSSVLTNHGHYNESMSHNWGANLVEYVLRGDYTYKRWTANFHISVGVQGKDDEDTNWGENIYLSYDSRESDDNNAIGQGNKSSLTYVNANLGYILNPSYNLRVEGGVTLRNYSPERETNVVMSDNMVFISFGLRTALFNNYYDF